MKDILTQNGIIAFLFVLTFVAFIYKGIPFAIKKFDEVLMTFQKMQESQQKFFREELQKISDTFINNMLTHNQINKEHVAWHRSHDVKLDELKRMIIPEK